MPWSGAFDLYRFEASQSRPRSIATHAFPLGKKPLATVCLWSLIWRSGADGKDLSVWSGRSKWFANAPEPATDAVGISVIDAFSSRKPFPRAQTYQPRSGGISSLRQQKATNAERALRWCRSALAGTGVCLGQTAGRSRTKVATWQSILQRQL